jgi:DNA-directed RNA polymerase subunit RPC12/RpoP
MSYITFQQRCKSCEKTWNAAFGIVGITRIASPPSKCPHCGSKEIAHHADGWDVTTPHCGSKEIAYHADGWDVTTPKGFADIKKGP